MKAKNMNLIIAAHPDDEILGCGGIIKKYSESEDFAVVIMTGGAEGRYSSDMEATLRKNAEEANAAIGTKELFFESFPNQKLESVLFVDIITAIEGYISKLKPRRVFTHFANDLNKDHQILAEATFTATRPIVGQVVKEVYSYNVPSSTEWNMTDLAKMFVPNVFVDIKDEIEAKIEAMKRYPSECRPYPHPRSPDALRVHANYWGLTVGIEYAEPFRLIRNLSILD